MLSTERFTEEYERNFNKTVNFCRRKLSTSKTGDSLEVAREMAQDAWLKAWEKRIQFRSECSLASWVSGIALNLIIGRYRERWYKTERMFSELPPAKSSSGPDPIENGGAHTPDYDNGILVDELTRTVERKHRRVIRLMRLGYSVEESAKVLKKTFLAAKMTRHRAIEAMRDAA